jgi:aryl-alcohol dehydrogenase-like predicted oxidoreductase
MAITIKMIGYHSCPAALLQLKYAPALLLKFILAHKAVTCVIPGTGDPRHIHEILEAATGSLPDEATLKHMRELA